MVPRAERGLTIGEQAETWAQKRREKIIARPPSETIRVVKLEVAKDFFSLPPLAENDKRKYTVRFRPSRGEIIIPFWREVEIEKSNGKRALANPSAFSQLRRPREHRVNFEDLPPREVVELIPATSKSLEGAIRQQVHVMDKYKDGKEAVQVEEVMKWLSLQMEAVLGGRVNRLTLRELASSTAIFLESSGLISARISTKKRIAGALAKAFQLDIRGRPNLLLTMINLRSAYLREVKREMLPVLIMEKFGPFFGILLMEREFTRRIIEGAAGDLDTLAGISKRGAVAFEKPHFHVSFAERQGMERVLQAIALSLARVRVLPYLPAARQAAINLVGCREDKRELNRGLLGPQADEFFRLMPVKELIDLGDLQKARERIIALSFNPLMKVLEENKEIGVEIS